MRIIINNTSEKEITYNVETDLGEVISGLSRFVVRPQTSYPYDFNVKPLLGKIYFGKITFMDEKSGNYIWYTIKIEAKSQYQAQTIEMRSTIRKTVYIDICLDNPLEEYVVFNVDFEGDYLIVKEKEIRIDPLRSINYQLFFAPLRVGTWEGRVHIYNDSIGEFLYNVKLICDDNPPQYPDIVKSELGKSVDIPIFLENPSAEEVKVSYTNTNSYNFEVVPEKVTIPHLSSREIIIRYSPSSLDREEEAKIIFNSLSIGSWIFNFRGKGIPPEVMDPVFVNTYVGGITSGMINFKNPFNESLNVIVELKSEDWPGTFKLLSKTNKYTIDRTCIFLN